jgi:transcriptional regulator with XRE-family HTH domain
VLRAIHARSRAGPTARRRPRVRNLRFVPENLPFVKNPFKGPVIAGKTRNMKFDFEKFYQAVNAKRTERAASWRQVAREIGIGKSTLARMAQNKRPDADGLAALSFWAEINPADFVRAELPPPLAHRDLTDDEARMGNGIAIA